MRWLLLALFPLIAMPSTALAVPPVDPLLTYVMTVYDRDQKTLAPDGTRVSVIELPRVRERRGAPFALCGEAVVTGGRAVLRVEVTPECPEGMLASLALLDLPGGGITAYSEPTFEWRRAYSEVTTHVGLVVRPIPPRTSSDPRPVLAGEVVSPPPVVCPPNRPEFGEARTVAFAGVSFDVPPGRYRWFESSPNSGSIVVCQETNAGVQFSSATCAETARIVMTNEQQAAFDAIVASCRMVPRN